MSDIGPRDELYMMDPEGKLEKMDPGTHHLEHLMNFYPDEEDYNEDFWDVVFDGGWIRVELKENHRNGWDLALNGKNLYRMKSIVRDKFLERLKRGENKVHIEEWTGTGMNPTHIFYLPAQKDELFDFLFEKLKAKFISESLNFERGIDPKDSMNIGNTEVRREKLIKEIIQFNPRLILNYKGGMDPFMFLTSTKNPEWDKSTLRNVINPELSRVLNYLRGLSESQNFERGLEPKVSIGVGLASKIKQCEWPELQYLILSKDADFIKFLSDGKYTIHNPKEFMESYKHGADVYKKYVRPRYTSYKFSSDFRDIIQKKLLKIRASETEWHINMTLNASEVEMDSRMKGLKESLDFERGLDPKDAMGIGKTSEQKIIEMLREDEKDLSVFFGIKIQEENWLMETPHHGYCIEFNLAYGKSLKKPEEYAKKLLKKVGLFDFVYPQKVRVQNIQLAPMFRIKEEFKKFFPEGDYNVIDLREDGLLESLDFERGLDPKESMTIGTKAQKNKLDKETDWGFEFSHAFRVRTYDIIEYEGFLIKIVQVMGSDGVAYYATLNNTGEPYNNTPPLYNTPEEALDWEQKYIDQYNMGL